MTTGVPRKSIPFGAALEQVLAAAPGLAERLSTELVPLDEALGRVLAEPLIADSPFPRFDNSAVDGYAVRLADVRSATEQKPIKLPVTARVAAGEGTSHRLDAGQAIRVMTGAPLPAGTEAVVMREHTDEEDDCVRIRVAPEAAANVRPAGEDVAEGETILEAGAILAGGAIGAHATFGRERVAVVRRPRVALLSTGDELRAPGEPLAPGEIYDSNSFTLRAAIRESGGEVGESTRVADRTDAVRQALERLLASHDLVLTLGGISAGDHDVVKLALPAFPEVSLWKVGMRPGGPQAFGRAGDSLLYGLPGNPVSSAVVFDRLVRPLIRTAMGARPVDRPHARARLLDPVPSREGRRDFVRVRLLGEPGSLRARLTGNQSSGAVTSLARASGLAVISEVDAECEAGTDVEVILWEGWGESSSDPAPVRRREEP